MRCRPGLRIALAAACAALFLLMGMGGYAWIQLPVSYVSIDVDPSIELALNRFDKVISVAAYNDEGKRIIEKLSLKGKKYTEAIDLLVESEDMKSWSGELCKPDRLSQIFLLWPRHMNMRYRWAGILPIWNWPVMMNP